jgi:hypothetical protein
MPTWVAWGSGVFGKATPTCGVTRAPSRFASPGLAFASCSMSGVFVARAAR